MRNGKYTFFEFSGSMVKRYDLFNHLSTFGLDALWRKKTAMLLKNSLNSKQTYVLDLACGTGDMAIAIQKQTDAIVIGVDPSAEMLHLFKQKQRTSQKIQIVTAADDLPFKTNSFHAVTCAFGVRNFVRLEKNLMELRRLLVPNGKIYILDFFKPENNLLYFFLYIYSKTVLQLLGFILNRKIEPYNYLYFSIVRFYTTGNFCKLIQKIYHGVIESRPLFFGLAHLIVAENNV
jgi:demethylmenaquinone methyltransferase/2-methoxy-6-polyprenyl-1,4-benzoquinol methylase